MNKQWVLGTLAIAALAVTVIIIGLRGAQADVYAEVMTIAADNSDSTPRQMLLDGVSDTIAEPDSRTKAGVGHMSLTGGTPLPHRAGEWQCWDDGALDPCHRNLEQIQALTDNDIWIAAGGSNSKGVLHYDGAEWQEMDIPPTGLFGGNLKSLHMLSPTDGWAVGIAGPWHWDGTTWRDTEIDGGWGLLWLEGLDIVATDDIWAVGRGRTPAWVYMGVAAHWDGWSWETTAVSDTLNSVSMISSSDGWAVGVGGSIYHWDNTAWISVTSPVTDDLYSVATFNGDPDNAWAVGDGGVILHYDGGDWSAINSPVTESLMSIAMISETHGWIVGDAGAILHYDGADWTTSTSPTGADLASVTVVSTNSAYAVSTDGGLIHWNGSLWETLFEVPERRELIDVVMLAPDDGWVAGEGGRLVHWDGSDWNPVDSHTGEILEALDFLATDDGWAVGGEGTILHYTGTGWVTVTSPTGARLRGVDVISSTEGWAVGDGGTILRFNGTAWINFTSPTTITLQAVRMAAADDGWAVGGGFSGNWDIGYLDVILHWDGAAWNFGMPSDSFGGFFVDLAIVAPDDVYATNIFGLAHWDGASWSNLGDPQVGQAAGIDMYSADEGWATGWPGNIAHWDGHSWEMIFNRTHNIQAVDAIAPHKAWAVCGEWSGGAILHYTAPPFVQGTLIPGASLTHAYAGHETRITLGAGTAGFSETFTVSYKLRPSEQGYLKGIDHFFELAADEGATPLTVTVRYSDTQAFDVFSPTLSLYRLESGKWVADGITIVDLRPGELKAVTTQPGSFGVMGVNESTVFVTSAPEVSTTLVHTDSQGSPTTLAVPVGAVTDTTTIVYMVVLFPTQPAPPGLRSAGYVFDLDAYRGGNLIPGFTFEKAVTLTVEYSDADVAGLDEKTLALYRWTWGTVDMWEPIGVRQGETYTLDIENNLLTAYLLSFSRFAEFGVAIEYHLFLPLVLKND